MTTQAVIVRRYKAKEIWWFPFVKTSAQTLYERDALKLAAQGYTVVSTATEQKGAGCLSIAAFGIFAFRGRDPVLVVTYQHA